MMVLKMPLHLDPADNVAIAPWDLPPGSASYKSPWDVEIHLSQSAIMFVPLCLSRPSPHSLCLSRLVSPPPSARRRRLCCGQSAQPEAPTGARQHAISSPPLSLSISLPIVFLFCD